MPIRFHSLVQETRVTTHNGEQGRFETSRGPLFVVRCVCHVLSSGLVHIIVLAVGFRLNGTPPLNVEAEVDTAALSPAPLARLGAAFRANKIFCWLHAKELTAKITM